MKTIMQSLRALAVLTVLTGGLYPVVVTLVGQAGFAGQAGGSLIREGGKIEGSTLLAQKTESPIFFWPRPSGADFATVASGASNKGPTSADLVKAIGERKEKFGAGAPGELLTASGSGLDPHLSPEAARYQAARVAAERKIPVEKVQALIDQLTEGPQWGLLGEPRVNVLALNRELEKTH
jgi:potassium-transporting ATPase KdpC subunit